MSEVILNITKLENIGCFKHKEGVHALVNADFLHLLDPWMTPQERNGEMLCSSSVVFLCWSSWHPLGVILSIHETPEWLQGLENVTGVSINIVVSS